MTGLIATTLTIRADNTAIFRAVTSMTNPYCLHQLLIYITDIRKTYCTNFDCLSRLLL